MDEVIIEKQEYLLFDKYKLNTNRNITRYEYISNVPLKVSKREPDMRVCKCGAHLITLAYRKEVICMGLLDAIFGNNQPPKINSILPTAAKNEIRAGRLPILNTDSLFLKRGEKIHYIDKAINLEIKVVKQYRHVGHSTPGLLKGNRWNVGVAKPIEHGELVQHRGILYVTNQRIVFQASEKGFDKTYRYLTAVTPYVDACELQFGSKTYNMYVDDGNLLYEVLQLVQQRRQIP